MSKDRNLKGKRYSSLSTIRYLKLRFLVHAAATDVWSIDVAKRLPGCVIDREARPYHAEVFFHAADEIRAFHRDSLRADTRERRLDEAERSFFAICTLITRITNLWFNLLRFNPLKF